MPTQTPPVPIEEIATLPPLEDRLATAGSADPTIHIGKTIAGFQIEELIIEGGMGWIFRAKQLSLGRHVALKILPPHFSSDESFRERFRREAATLATLTHPGIVQVYEAGLADNVAFIAMEYVVGPNGTPTTLRDVLHGEPTEPRQAQRWIIQLCDTLKWVHEKGVVHRDIKPSNVLIDTHGSLRLTDFGIAQVFDRDGSRTGLTHAGDRMGTLDYMAPEQRRDPSAVDCRADIFSLGVILYEMLTGHLPIGRFELPSESPPRVDPQFDRIVDRAISRRPEHRYASVVELRQDLARVQYAHSSLTTAGPLVRAQRPPSEKTINQGKLFRLVVGIGAAATCAIGVVALAWWNWIATDHRPNKPIQEESGKIVATENSVHSSLVSPTNSTDVSSDGHIESTSDAVERSNERGSMEKEFFIAQGLANRKDGKLAEAAADLSKVIQIDPTNSSAFAARGVVYSEMKDDERALADFTEAIRFDPKNCNALCNRAAIFLRQGEFEKAIQDCTDAIRLNPDYADAYLNRGAALVKKAIQGENPQDFDIAIADLTEGIRLNADDANAFFNADFRRGEIR